MNKKSIIAVIIVLVVIIGIIVGTSFINNDDSKKPNNTDTGIKSFEQVAEEYGLTVEELEWCIQNGISPEDFK